MSLFSRMDIIYVVKIVMIVNLMNLSMFDVDASFHSSISTNPTLQRGTRSTNSTTFTIEETTEQITTTITIKATKTSVSVTLISTSSSETSTPVKNKTSTILWTGSTGHSTSTKPHVKDNNFHDEHEHKLMFYISVGVGSAFVVLLFSLIVILARWYCRKKSKAKRRVVYWAKTNRACQSEYIPNEEVATNNPMYEGSRSRTTSNVLYGVPEYQENIATKFSQDDEHLPASIPTEQSAKPDLVISNTCALYQNAEDLELYSEPGKVPAGVDNGNYERIRSFIHNENSEANATPAFLFVTENTGYVSAVYKPK